MIRHLFKLIWNRKKQNGLLILEMVFAFLILFAVLSFVYLNVNRFETPLGFETENRWVAHLTLPPETDSLTVADTKYRLKQNLEALPEVEHIGFSNWVTPFGGSAWITTGDDNGFELRTYMVFANEDYAETMGLNLIEGRWMAEADSQGKYQPMVINKMLRDRYFKDTNIVNGVIKLNGEYKVVGVVDHFKYHGEFEEEKPLSFFPLQHDPEMGQALLIKLREGAPPDLEVKVNQIIKQTAKGWDFAIQDLDAKRSHNSRPTWIAIIALLSICGFLIFNVALGLFGVLMYSINRRRPEIGLRRAVGASPYSIVSQFIGEIMLLSGLGVLIGILLAVQVPILNMFDIESSIYIKAILSSVSFIFLLVLICTLYPSLQASMIHPAIALHEE